MSFFRRLRAAFVTVPVVTKPRKITKAEAVARFDAYCDQFGMPEAKAAAPRFKKIAAQRFGKGEALRARFVELAIDGMTATHRAELTLRERQAGHAKAVIVRTEPVSTLAAQAEHLSTLAGLPSAKFYVSREWRQIRRDALEQHQRRCDHCGAAQKSGAELFAVHKISRLIKPERAFDLRNLLILCRDCREAFKRFTAASTIVKQHDDKPVFNA